MMIEARATLLNSCALASRSVGAGRSGWRQTTIPSEQRIARPGWIDLKNGFAIDQDGHLRQVGAGLGHLDLGAAA